MDIVAVYEQLAELEEQRGEGQPRDRFLILAADAALAHGDNDRAEALRGRLLEFNPHHLLKPYPSFADSLKAPDVFGYVADLRHSYPPEEAERLLASLQGGGAAAVESEPFPQPASAPEVIDEPEEPLIYPLSRSEPRPSVPEKPAMAAPARLAPAARPAARPTVEPEVTSPEEVYPLPRRSPAKVQRPEASLAVSDWVASFLFAILLVAALGLATYTVARPFFTP